MKNGFWSVVLIAIMLDGAADAAWAWGPATHVGLADTVLEHLSLLPAAIAALLTRHPKAFLYGNIAADVVFAKRWSRVKQFCHHWSTGFQLKESAQTDAQRAFALGYLSHLAADTVVHGKYVPRQILVCGSTVNFGHLYWELRADAAARPASWRRLEALLALDHQDHHDLLARHVRDTLLPFDLNRFLFARMNELALRPSFRKTVNFCGRYSLWPLPDVVLNGYRSESVDRILSILTFGTKSPVLREDPNGTSAFMHLRVQRKKWNRLRRRGVSIETPLREASLALAPHGATTPSAAYSSANLYA